MVIFELAILVTGLSLLTYPILDLVEWFKEFKKINKMNKEETLQEAAERRYGTDMDSIRSGNVYDLNTDLKRGFVEGIKSDAAKDYWYTQFEKQNNKHVNFSKHELETIKVDVFHILKHVNLSEEHKEIRGSILDKIEILIK